MKRCLYCVVLLGVTLVAAPGAVAQTCTPQTLPWYASFEENETGLGCWTLMTASSQAPTIATYAIPSSGSRALVLAARGDDESLLLATPRMAYRADSLLVSFNLTLNSEAGMLQVGLVSDSAVASTFVPLLNIDLTAASTGYYEFYTTPSCGTDSLFVAFRLTQGMVNIDEVAVAVATDCRRPQQPWIGDVDNASATVGWSSSGGTASAYLVRYIAVATGDTAYATSYATVCTLINLQPGTAYNVAVATLCGYDTTAWLPIGTVVTDVNCRQPIGAAVASLAANSAAITWSYDTTGVNQPTAMTVSLFDVTNAPVQVGSTMTVATSYAFVDNLMTGHRYEAVLQTVCSADTASPVTVGFIPLADACVEHSGTGLSSTLPLNSQRPYSLVQMLYPSSILAGMDSLYAMAVRVENSMAFAPRTIDVYVGYVVDSAIVENVSTMSSIKVLDNYSFDNETEGWVTMVFDMPINVDTTRNLLITIVDSTAIPMGPIYFGTHTEAYGGSLYGYSLTQPYDPAAFDIPLSAISQVADLRLYGDCAASACQPPATIVTSVTTSSIALQWIGSNAATAVRYRAKGTGQWLTAIASGELYTVNGLNAATVYELQVGAVCNTDTAYGPIIVAMTECGSVNIPYFADFSSGAHPCWQGLQQTMQNVVSLNNGLVSPQLNVSPSNLQVKMRLRNSGVEEHVYVGVASLDGESVTWVDTVLVDFGTYEERIAYLDSYNGGGQRVVLLSDGNVALSWVVIEPLDDCLPPRHITVRNVGDVSATLSWQEAGGQTYDVYLRETSGNLWAMWQTSTNQLTLTGLQANTDYVGYAVSHCTGVAEASIQSWFRFSTGCGVIRYLPYSESFEASDAIQCWKLGYADEACATANPMIVVQNTAHSGNRSFRFSSYNAISSDIYNQFLISPRISLADSITVSFYYTKSTLASEPFKFGISTEDDDIDNFVWYNQIEPVAGSWEQFTKRLPGGIKYVAIQYVGQQNNYLFIDDFTIDGAGCEAPTIIGVDEQADHVTVSWQADADSVRLAITDGMWLDDVEGVSVAGNSYTFNGLQPGRNYTVGVRSICPDGHLSVWNTRSVVTIDTLCLAPVDLMLDSISYTTADISWTPRGGASQWQLSMIAAGELMWLSQPLTSNAYTLEGLENNRYYSILVRSLCSDIPGPWSDTLHIQTVECLPVSEVSYERVNFRTVTLSWEDAPVTIGRCRIEYGLEGFARGTGAVMVANTNPVTINGLEPEPNYDFYIQNYCEPGVLSDSAVYLYVPTGLGIDVLGERCPVATVYPNPATSDIRVNVDAPAVVGLTDMLGRQVIEWTKVVSSLLIPYSSLSAGTYFVRVANDAGSTTIKLIVR